MLQYITKNRYSTIAKFAEMFGVHVKTIRRDLQILEEAGFPLYRAGKSDYGAELIRIDRDWLKLNGGLSERGPMSEMRGSNGDKVYC